MTSFSFDAWLKNKPIVGMLHLPALPGSPQARESLSDITKRVLADAITLAEAGCHGLMMENFGDTPFFPGRVPAYVVAFMTSLARSVRQHAALPLGINVLRNDALSALAIAAASDASFIRVNVLTGARITDQGVIGGVAHDLLRERSFLGANHINILADVDVKHSAPLAPRPLTEEVKETLGRGLADGLVISGSGTGAQVDLSQLKTAKAAAGKAPVFIGSGTTVETLPTLMRHADAFIVGTALKFDTNPNNPVDPVRVKTLVAAHKNELGIA